MQTTSLVCKWPKHTAHSAHWRGLSLATEPASSPVPSVELYTLHFHQNLRVPSLPLQRQSAVNQSTIWNTISNQSTVILTFPSLGSVVFVTWNICISYYILDVTESKREWGAERREIPEFGEVFNSAFPKHNSRIRGRTQIKQATATRGKAFSAVSLFRFNSCAASSGVLTDVNWEISKP